MYPRFEDSRHGWLLFASLGLVMVLTFWCRLHASVLGAEPVGLDVSLPWACRISIGWILAAFGLRWFSARNPSPYWWPAAAIGVTVLTLTSESLLVREGMPLMLWLYEKAPLHFALAGLMTGGFWIIRKKGVPAADAQWKPPAEAARERSSDLVEVMTGTGHASIRIQDIEFLEAERNYINVHTPERTYLLRRTLASLEESLARRNFERVHRSIIVNRDKIREWRRGGVLVLRSGREVRVSRGYSRKRLDGWSR
jgi:hypothetical protein